MNKFRVFVISLVAYVSSISILFAVNYNSGSEKSDKTPPLMEGRIEKSTSQMYGEDDLGASSLFAGGFINFGFWKIPQNIMNIDFEQRVESQKNMYRFVMRQMKLSKTDVALEVGCGQGVGIALVFNEFHPKEIYGIDFSEQQILRSIMKNQSLIKKYPKKVFFKKGDAENLPFSENYFDKIFSVEAAQHFVDLLKFAKEACRILKPNGQLAVVTFFGTSEESQQFLSKTIQTIRDKIDLVPSIQKFKKMLKEAGFKNIRIKSIGRNVFWGYDKWVSQGEYKNSWSRNFYKGYKDGFLDYYLVTANK